MTHKCVRASALSRACVRASMCVCVCVRVRAHACVRSELAGNGDRMTSLEKKVKRRGGRREDKKAEDIVTKVQDVFGARHRL